MLTFGDVRLVKNLIFEYRRVGHDEPRIPEAVVAGFLISALGGSRLQIGGPTGAFVVIVAGIVATHGVSGLLIVTIMAGVILMLMAVTGLGSAVKYIPRPVTIGFTNGIAVLIASTQIKDFLGLETGAVPGEFLLRMRLLVDSLGSIRWPAVLLAISSLLIILLLPKLTKRVPGSIVALVIATLTVAAFGLPVETIGSKFGGIPTGLPDFLTRRSTRSDCPAAARRSYRSHVGCHRKPSFCRSRR